MQPSASLAGVSGLDAIVSGNYITLLPGEGDFVDEFIAEEDPPAITVSDGDLLIRLISDDIGSITVGASVYFRKVPVGNIADYRFTKDQKKIEIDVVINQKYAHLVKKESRFWNISGISADVNLQGIKINMDSLASVVQGAVAFDSPDNMEIAEQGQKFELYPDLKSAKRGIEINVKLPLTHNLKINETGVFHQNVQIGMLSQLKLPQVKDNGVPQQESGQHKQIDGVLLIDQVMKIYYVPN
ncbi:paraquat-inducible protein B [Mannheimia haemolytica]|uniref:Paraquat-inducible protein B n=1 Tax=Mannheimia haemolytica TaxID=75985 RepID=A0A378NAM5_MANHA|nr:paraquat-inducible protein B [Mannheimia haemolytica]